VEVRHHAPLLRENGTNLEDTVTRGRFYDHNFRRFLTIFGVFLSKPMLWYL
jgi:hypothetical protein